MSTILADSPLTHTPHPAARRLRRTMAAVRLSFTWFGVRRSLTPQQKAVAAESFGAAGEFLSAGKKLLDTRHPAFRAVTAIRGRLLSLWKSLTLPYPEPGIRLLRQDQLDEFQQLLNDLRNELHEAVEQLNEHFADLRSAARQRLGQLYNPADYPDTLLGLFDVEWEFPALEPPDYLRDLSPALFEQECQRVAARFDEAVQLAEQAFLEELAKLVSHLTERLAGSDDGKPKVFRDSAVDNLAEFFDRFRRLNVRSNQELDDLVNDCQRIVQGVAPQDLRTPSHLREQIATELMQVQHQLDDLLQDRPRRRILRQSNSREGAG